MTTPPPPPPEEGWPEPDAPTVVGPGPGVPPPPVGPPPPADRRIGAGMLLGLGAIAIVALGALIAYLLTHRHHHHSQATTVVVTQPTTTGIGLKGGGVAVPDVRKVKADQATSVLHSVGLKVRTVTGSASGQAPGTVVSESPQPGAKVAKGSEVLLTVTPKPAKPTGTTTAATTTTSATTTTVQTTTQQQTTTSTTPAQPTSAPVPDLSGMDEQAAATALGKAGLLASLAFVPSQDPLGTVEAQGKPAGTTVSYHDHVLVNVSTGPGQKAQETVPDVRGKTLQQALAAINGAQLRLLYLKFPVTSQAQAGKVVQQTPNGGDHAPQNAQVIVYLGALQK